MDFKTVMHTNSIRRLSFFLVLMACMSSAVLIGQQRERYTGPLQVGDYLGEAEYYYLLAQGDTILDGPFSLQRSNLAALLEKGDASFVFRGGFRSGYPQGAWIFQFGEFQSDSQTQVVDYQYTLNVSGIQTDARGTLQMGKPQGDWKFTTSEVKGSLVVKTLFDSEINFEQGIPQQSFKIADTSNTLVGRFLRDGVAHDVWELYSEGAAETTESWQFSEGVLTKIQGRFPEKDRSFRILDPSMKNAKIILLDERYLQILRLWLVPKDTIALSKSAVADLLTQNAKYYQKIDDILSQLGTSEFQPEFKVKVPYYPLDTLERRQLDTLKVHFNNAQQLGASLLDNTQLNILKRSDEEAHFLYQVVEAFSEQFLTPLEQLVRYDSQEVIAHVSRDKLINALWPSGKPSATIRVNTGLEKDTIRNYNGPKNGELVWEQNSFEALRQLAEYAALSLDAINRALGDKLVREQRQQEIVRLEEQLLSRSDSINRFLRSAEQELPEVYRNAVQNIKTVVEAQLSEYSSRRELSQKADFGNQLLQCLGTMDTLAKQVVALPQRVQGIEEAYQDAVWNPFTATIMNERIKKRITNAYRKVIVPYMLNQITTTLDCENAQPLSELLENTYQKMLALKEEETRKLERKLKKTQDPIEILTLFNLMDTANQD